MLSLIGLTWSGLSLAQTYCSPGVVNLANWGCGMQDVTVGSMSNSTGQPNSSQYYFDYYSQLGASATAGSNVNVSLRAGSGNASRFAIYIDWNKDGVFSAAEQMLLTGTVNSTATFNGSIAIPAAQATGVYRMRIVGDISFVTIDPCQLQYSGEVEDYAFSVVSASLDVAAVSASQTVSIGNNTLSITAANLTSGTNISSLDFGYRLNNNTPVTESVNGLNLTPGALFSRNFTTNLNISTPGIYTLKMWVRNPNGNGSGIAGNDTITRVIQACYPLNGTYTIDPNGSGGSNYTNFASAVSDLAICGISGPVTFNVASGTFNEQVRIPAISGVSANNTVRFVGAGKTSTVLNFANQTTDDRYTVMFDGASFIEMRNMTIRSSGTSFGWTVLHTGSNGVSNIKLNNLLIDCAGSGANTTSTNFIPVVYCGSRTSYTANVLAFNNRIDSCDIDGGYINISFSGNTATNANYGNYFTYNTMTDAYLYGVYANYLSEIKIKNNTITPRTTGTTTTGSYGMYIINSNNSYPYQHEIVSNKVFDCGRYGIYLSSASGSVGTKGLMANNFVGGNFRNTSSVYGIYLNFSSWWNVYFNSVNVDNNVNGDAIALYLSNSTNTFTLDVRNNMLQVTGNSTNPLALYANANTIFADLDYNNYWVNNSNNLIFVGQALSNTAFSGVNNLDINSKNLEAPYQSATNLRYANGCISGIQLSQVTKDIDGDNRTNTPNIGADEFINTATNDIGVAKILQPFSPVSVGQQNVVVRIKNYGTNTITSAQVGYTLNSGTPVTISWTGTLLPCGEVDVTFTGANAITIGPGVNTIRAYTALPGGNTDNFPSNDALQMTVCPAMNGTFTIDANGSGANNFTSFTNAVAALSCSGLNGPVVLNVAPGNYVEQVALRNISGLSSQNTITIQGQSGQKANTVLAFNATNNAARHTLLLDNMQYVSIKNLTIRSLGSTYGWVVHLFGTSSDISIDSCTIEVAGGGASSTSGNFAAILFNNDLVNTGNAIQYANISIRDNDIRNGYYGLYVTGNGQNSTNLVVERNRFINTYYYGIFHNNSNSVKFQYNDVNMRTGNANSYGMYIINTNANGSNFTQVNYNRVINAGRFGINFSSANNTASFRGELINNMIGGGFTSTSTRGLALQSSNYWNVWHNSVNVDWQQSSTTAAAFYASSASFLDVRNNNFALTHPNQNSGSIYPVYMNGSTSLICDYNNYYKPGSTSNFVRINGVNYNAVNFKGGGGFNVNSYFSLPGFVSSLDLHASSGCLIAPRLTAVTLDFDGDSRGASTTIGADEGIALDALITNIISPAGTNSSGTQDVQFYVKNGGQNAITSFSAGYKVNGQNTVTTNWAGTLNPCDSVLISFTGGQAANIPNSGLVSIAAFVGGVNSIGDNNRANDTLARSYCNGPLDGLYTLNSSSSASRNFSDIQSLMAVLNSCGMAGNVEIQVAPGVYTGQILLNPATIGGLDTNTFAMHGVDSASTRITFNGGGYTLRLDGVSNAVFTNLGFENTATSNNFTVHLTNGSNSNTFSHCDISAPSVSNSSVIAYGVFGPTSYSQSGLNWGNGNLLEYSTVRGGWIGVNFYGSGNTSTMSLGNTVSHCVITEANYYGSYSYMQDGPVFTDNRMDNPSSAQGVMYFSFCPSISVQRNIITGGFNYGIFLSQASPSGYPTSNVINNMVGGSYGTGTSYGIYAQSTANTNFFHNTVYMSADNGSSRAFYHSSGTGNQLINNTLISDAPNGYAMFINTNNTYSAINFNNIVSSSTTLAYTWGTNHFDLPSLQASNTTFNVNSVSVSPQFLSRSSIQPDLHLNPSWQAPYGANNLGVNVDVDGDDRCASAKTIGADESGFVDPVSVQFTVNDTVFVNSPFTAINADLPGTLRSYEWDFNNDGSVEFTTLNATFTYNSAGVKQIKLTSRSCNGGDSIVKQIVVVTPSAAPEADFIADMYSAAPFDEVRLQDLSTNGPIGWTWEITPDPNGLIFYDPFEQNPVVFFGEPGVFDVCLTAQNALGTSAKKCKTAYITIRDVNNMCIGNQSSSAASGEIYDSGGPVGSYGNNENCDFLIEPCASSVTLKFTEFSLANAAHVLRVYDGRDATGTLLGTFSSTSGLPGGTNGLTANSGAMYLTWQTSATGTASGFAARWTSVADTSNTLIAGFDVQDSAFEQETVPFTNTSIGSGLIYSWDFNMDNNEDSQIENPSFQFTAAGTYYPSLSVSDACGNSQTVQDTIVIITPSSAPIVDFEADAKLVAVGDLVYITDKTTNGPIGWTYTFSPNNAVIAGGTNRNPIVSFTDTGWYTVTLDATNAAGTASATKTQYIHVVEICNPSVDLLVPDLGINRVTLNNLANNSSSGVQGFTSYFNSATVPAAQLDAGGNYTLFVARNTTLNRMNRKAWIDFNGDGDFNDQGEFIGHETAALTPNWAVNFTVPVSAVRGAVRMRIGVAFADSTNEACGTNFYGEIEDYRVQINEDITAPVISLRGFNPVTLELGQNYLDSGATAFDAVDGNLTSQIVATNNLNINVAGTYQYFYNVSDAAGNAATTVTRTIIVRPDNTPPVLQLNTPLVITVPLLSSFTEPGWTAIDAISGNVSATVQVDKSNFDSTRVGSYSIIYVATDGFGNTDTQSRVVNVVDLTAPTLTLNGVNPMEVEVYTNFNDPGVSATDNYDPMVFAQVSSNVNVNALGSYLIQYSATDSSGNVSSLTRTVNVVDNTAPTLIVSGPDTLTVEVFGSVAMPQLTATDNYDQQVQVNMNGTYDLTQLGVYSVTFTAEDASGNQSASVSRFIKVVDTEAPVITLNGAYLITIDRWASFVDPGVTISDNYYTGLVATTGGNFVDTDKEGLFYITYDVTDGSGNVAAQITRAVNVVFNPTSVGAKVNEMKLSVYPNPARDFVVLDFKTDINEEVSLEVVNGIGQQMMKDKVQLQGGKYTLNTDALTPGTYFILVNLNGTVRTQKLIVNK